MEMNNKKDLLNRLKPCPNLTTGNYKFFGTGDVLWN